MCFSLTVKWESRNLCSDNNTTLLLLASLISAPPHTGRGHCVIHGYGCHDSLESCSSRQTAHSAVIMAAEAHATVHWPRMMQKRPHRGARAVHSPLTLGRWRGNDPPYTQQRRLRGRVYTIPLPPLRDVTEESQVNVLSWLLPPSCPMSKQGCGRPSARPGLSPA